MLVKGVIAKDKQDMLPHTCGPSTLSPRQEGCNEFKATVCYGVRQERHALGEKVEERRGSKKEEDAGWWWHTTLIPGLRKQTVLWFEAT